MSSLILVLLGLVSAMVVAVEECCSEKEVGQYRYFLVDQENTSAYGCESDCIYSQENFPASRFCFKQGHLPVQCLEADSPDWMAVRIIPGGFDNARGHYFEHAIDTEYIHKLNYPGTSQRKECNKTYPFRKFNGECNNFKNRKWGATGALYQRFLPNAYENAYENKKEGIPRGGRNPSRLPSPRVISREFHNQMNRTALTISNLFWQFGQYIGHDTGLTPEVNLDLSGGFNNTACAEEKFIAKFNASRKCFNINVSNDTFYYNQKLPTYPWLGFARTMPNNYIKAKTVREQINAGTGFMDASITYGFNKTLNNQLRANHSGLLLSGTDNLLPIINVTVAPSNSNLGKNVKNIAAGDPRVNLDPFLLSVQTMFFREHNRLAKEISKESQLNDEHIFQTARKILIAQYQNIIFNEFIPLVIGNDTVMLYNLSTDNYSNYNETLNPTIHNGFQTAAARFGHSMVQGSMKLQNLKGGHPLDHELKLKNNYFNDSSYSGYNGYSEVLGGLSIASCQKSDRYLDHGVTDFLFNIQGENNYGDDLASRNIQRGRDHGLPGYMKYREYCGLSQDAEDINQTDWNVLMKIYQDKPYDIDLWTGGLAETPSTGAIVGPLFQCLLGKQYHNLKFGDRFFFTHRHQIGNFTEDQLKMIRARTMRDIICQNSDSPKIRRHAMQILDGEELINCTDEINNLNVSIFFA